MGKGIPLAGIFDKDHPRYSEAGEIRGAVRERPGRQEGRRHRAGHRGPDPRHRRPRRRGHPVVRPRCIDLIPLHMRDKDGVDHHRVRLPQCEDMGLVKMDFLGLRNLGVIDHAIKIIKENRGVDIDIRRRSRWTTRTPTSCWPAATPSACSSSTAAPMRDPAAADGARPSSRTSPRSSPCTGRARWRERAHQLRATARTASRRSTPIHPELEEPLEPILGTTFHLLVYQEQVMAIARELAGYTLGGADLLRRAMGKKKKEVLDEEFEHVPGRHAGSNGYSDEAIQALWDVMVPVLRVRVQQVAHRRRTAWSPTGPPTSRRTTRPSTWPRCSPRSVTTRTRPAIYLADAGRPASRSCRRTSTSPSPNFTAVGDDVRFGLGRSATSATNVIERSSGPQGQGRSTPPSPTSSTRSSCRRCNKRAVESLIKAGAFDSLGHTRKGLVAVHEHAVDAVIAGEEATRPTARTTCSAAGRRRATSRRPSGSTSRSPTASGRASTLLAIEREMLGLYVSAHPLDGTEHILSRNRDTTIAELLASGRTEGERTGCPGSSPASSAVEQAGQRLGDRHPRRPRRDRGGACSSPRPTTSSRTPWPRTAWSPSRGRLNDRDGAISIFGSELAVLDICSARARQQTTDPAHSAGADRHTSACG